ncbi:MAG: hypothetical protein LBV39_00145, partial [Bacteroidales bacterium]|nr:hypothetical protein [Bacteroidales bacterium]
MEKIMLFRNILFTIFTFNSLLLSAQVTIHPEEPPVVITLSVGDVHGGKYKVEISNNTVATLNAYVLKIDMPAGAEYIPGTATGIVSEDVTNLQSPSFTLSDIAASVEVPITFDVRLDCRYVHQNIGDDFFAYTLYDNAPTPNLIDFKSGDGPSSVLYPHISVGNLTPMIIDVNTPVARNITVQNTGARLDTVFI